MARLGRAQPFKPKYGLPPTVLARDAIGEPGNAAGVGTANDTGKTVATPSGLASGTGAANLAAGNVQPAAGNAAGTGTANNAGKTVATTGGVATGTGTANVAAVKVSVAASAATGTGTAYNATVTGVEYQRPISDITAGSWTTAPLWSKVDEVTIDDADLITSETLVSPGNTSSVDLRLNARGDPVSSTSQIISVRAKVAFTLGLNGGIRGELRQGNNVTSTLIGTLTTDALTTSFVTYTYTLSAGEADSITNYGDLFLRLYGNFPVGSLGGVTVSWVQFQQPAGVVPDTAVYPTAATGTGLANDTSTKIATSGGVATGSGTAGNSAGSVAGTSGRATGTGTVGAPAGADAVTAGNANGVGTAYDTTITATGTTPVTPEVTVSNAPGSSNRRGPYMTLERAQQDDEESILLLV